MTQAMIDIETLDTSVSAVVLSFGVQLFTDQGLLPERYHVALEIQSQLDAGRTISASTLDWWFKQSPAAQQAAFGQRRMSVRTALEMLAVVLNGVEHVWCRGLNFDVPIVDHLHAQNGMKTPWKYNKVRDSRTLLDLIPTDLEPKRAGVAHNALDDATHEAAFVVAGLQWLDMTRRISLGAMKAGRVDIVADDAPDDPANHPVIHANRMEDPAQLKSHAPFVEPKQLDLPISPTAKVPLGLNTIGDADGQTFYR